MWSVYRYFCCRSSPGYAWSATTHQLATGWAIALQRHIISLATLLICCLSLVILWHLRPINLSELYNNESDEDDDDGWGMDFPGHQAAIIASNIQLALSYSWYT